MSEQRVFKGETWRRKKDGLNVAIWNVRTFGDGEYDLYWHEIGGSRRGAIWQFNFLNAYERVETPVAVS